MSKTLIIVANPKSDSFSFAMADKYREVVEKSNGSVEILDLYRDEHQQPFFQYESANEIESTQEMKYFQQKITDADELAFVFPFWWGGMPAIMKNFVDWNFSNGFAFRYENSKPVGMLSGKRVKVFTTSGAPSFYYMLTGARRRLRNTIKNQIVDFCGMTMSGFHMFGGVDTHSKNTEEILQSIGG
jgi:NAD(P)H dehydrogenase (quinone)